MNWQIAFILLVTIFLNKAERVNGDKRQCTKVGGHCVTSKSFCQSAVMNAMCQVGKKCCERTNVKTQARKKENQGWDVKQRQDSTQDFRKRTCKKTTKKCSKRGGLCLHEDEECISLVGENLCKGDSCRCCKSSSACGKAKRSCIKAGGTCKDSCEIGEDEIPKGCKGKGCKCCVTSVESVEYQVVERGSLYSLDYRIFIIKNGLGPLSPFHDIPLFADKANNIFNMVVEIPRWSNAKMEIDTKDDLNPIKQDTNDDGVRYIANCFPYKGYIWNYGALPQTWEDPNHIDESTGQRGDNDPIDVCEIGYRVAKSGEVLQVKVLGVLALIDEGETDWKLIVIDINDPLASQLNDIDDLEEHMPGFINATVDWFRIYKVPSGKPENQFAFNGEPKNREFAHQVISETHEYWKALIEGRSDAGELSIGSVTVTNAVNKITVAEAQVIQDAAPQLGQPLPLDDELDTWHYCR